MTQGTTTYRVKYNPNWVLLIAVVALILVVIFFLGSKRKNPDFNQKTVYLTDTVYVDRFIEVEPEYRNSQKPQVVTIYKTDTVEVERVVMVRDTVTLVLKDSTKLNFNSNFLTQFPNSDKLIQLRFSQDNLSLGLVNPQGVVFSKDYPIDTRFLNYNYVNNNLTWERKNFFSRIQPLVQTTIRPLNNLYDLDLGLKYNTSKFSYELGINLSYYPKLKNNLGSDPYFRLRYEF